MADGLLGTLGKGLGRGLLALGTGTSATEIDRIRNERAAQEQQQALLQQILGGQAPQAPAGGVPVLGAGIPTVPGVEGISGQPTPVSGGPIVPGGGQRQGPSPFGQLQVLNPKQAQSISLARKAAFDNQSAREQQRIGSIVQGAAELQGLPIDRQIVKLEQRKQRLQAQGVPTNDTDEHLALLRAGRLDEANALTDQAVQLGGQLGILDLPKAAAAPTAKQEAETAKLQAETAQIRQKIAAGGPVSETDVKVLQKEREETVKINTKRIGELEQASKGRQSSITKARQFRRAFETGQRVSGTTRTVAGFFPGVFTSQAQFDEKLNSFAEVAARAKLKALGEIRPTDADVEGMKRSLFGIGRDEATNIQLLSDFIEEQENLDDELEDLRSAKAAGKLDSFVGFDQRGSADPSTLSDDELLSF